MKRQEIPLGDLAVLLIDMQEDFLDTQENRNLIPNQVSVLNFFKDKKVPIAVIEYYGHGSTTESLLEKIREIPNKPKKYVRTFTKRYNGAFSSFSGKSLDVWLKRKKVKTLLLMGVNANVCVYETANSAMVGDRYKIITSNDLIAGYCSHENCKRCADKAWYMENGLFTEDYISLLELIKAKKR